METILFLHTHWDREWYKPFQSFRLRLVEIIDILLEELIQNNIEYFYSLQYSMDSLSKPIITDIKAIKNWGK